MFKKNLKIVVRGEIYDLDREEAGPHYQVSCQHEISKRRDSKEVHEELQKLQALASRVARSAIKSACILLIGGGTDVMEIAKQMTDAEVYAVGRLFERSTNEAARTN